MHPATRRRERFNFYYYDKMRCNEKKTTTTMCRYYVYVEQEYEDCRMARRGTRAGRLRTTLDDRIMYVLSERLALCISICILYYCIIYILFRLNIIDHPICMNK